MAKKNKVCYANVGGQALIEGVMMRSPEKTVMAVRQPDGRVVIEDVPLKKRGKVFKFFSKVPFIRGILGFPTSIALGYKSLMRSAELSGLEDLEESEEPGKFEKWLNKVTGGNIVKFISWVSIFLSILICVAIFILLPGFLAKQLGLLFFGSEDYQHFDTYVTIIHAVLKIVIFIGYLALCAVMKDVRRTLMYHGAEHKSIHCLEAGEELTVENVKKCSRFHPRCSTSFLFVMLVFSIAFFVLLQQIFPFINWENLPLRYAVNIVCVPIIMGVGFEIIKLLGRFNNWLTKILAAPGLSMQFFTTKEPDEAQIEVAIASLCAALGREVPNFDRCEKKDDETAEGKTGEAPADETAEASGAPASEETAPAEEASGEAVDAAEERADA
ncbi:MAG: DUF1385 domain-containing protein [Clostridia bacterium]|nr:DUF1385 domain-containing protein [Clostridia bacterium]